MSKVPSARNWANFDRYEKENEKISVSNENRVVFIGDSITEGWSNNHPDFFLEKPYINRGINGQTTPQILLRFKADVINLNPKVVIILGGTNDIAGNTGPSSLEMILDNIIMMAEISKANGIKVILCSVLPVYDYYWQPEANPIEKIALLNKMIEDYADKNEIIYVDYYSSMINNEKGLKVEYSSDGVHPNKKGYKVMSQIIEKVIEILLL